MSGETNFFREINTEGATPVFIKDTVNTIKSQTNDFINFLVDKKVITIGIGLILASQLSGLVNNITSLVINPILHKFIKKDHTEKLEQVKVKWLGIEFELGKLISAFINFIFILLFLYLIYKLEVKLTNHVNGKKE
jgi:large-conductance mechanosensitive channel